MTQPRWRKSSYSNPNGACVELWRKASYSQVNGECVELAHTLDRVRDSKNPSGPALAVDLAGLLTEVKSGRFDLR